jgi:hypothetical protein
LVERKRSLPQKSSPVTPLPVPPSVWQVTGRLTRRPDTLDEDERLQLKKILDRSDALTTTHRHVREFAEMLAGRHGERLDDRMNDVQNNGAPALRTFADALRNDLGAITAGLTLDYSSGAVRHRQPHHSVESDVSSRYWLVVGDADDRQQDGVCGS